MLVLSSSHIKALLDMPTAIELVERAFITTSKGAANLPLRHAMPIDAPNMLGIMPGALNDPACYGTKLISLYPDNPAQGYSSHLGLMVLFEREHGTPSAVMNADALTALRTAAASGVATRALARDDANVLSIIGTGEQADNHIAAISLVRNIKEVRIAGRSREKATRFVDKFAKKHESMTLIACDSAQEAVAGADIVCSVTSSKEIVLRGDWLDKGTHVNAVGASVPTMREIDENLVINAALFVDYRPSAFAQARDIIEALESGSISKNHIRGEIGEVLDGRVIGRENGQQITLFRSMGIASLDLACAHFILQKAHADKIGTSVSID